MKYLIFVCLIFLFSFYSPVSKLPVSYREFYFSGFAQGTTYHVTYFAADEFVTQLQIDSCFKSIDSSLSVYKPYSLISRFNNAEREVELDLHLAIIVRKSLEIYKKTGGVSDITVYPLVKAWGFGSERQDKLPDSATIKSLLSCVGSDKIFIRNNRLIKTKPCIKIDVNGIAQGYTVDVIAGFLERHGIQDYLVEVGGEIRLKGRKQPDNTLFQVGIASPAGDSLGNAVMKRIVQFREGAITTSGNYRKFFERDGKIISHLMNPKTGYTFQNELISVTVRAKDAITADGYDNALMGMGLKNSFLFLKNHKELEAYFIYHQPNGSIADTATSKFREK